MQVLLLDDQASIRALLTASLKQHGWAVCQAGTLAEARKCLDGAGPHVIVADCELGGGENGHEFAADAWMDNGTIAVIYVTSWTERLSKRKLRPGEWALLKPFAPETLLIVIQQAIQHHRKAA